MADAAYQAKYLAAARLLWDASHGVPEDIPENYCEYLSHEYIDGDISLVPLLPKLDYTEELEDWEVDEAIELLGKVNPEDWPDIAEIESISAEYLLQSHENVDFVEDNLSTAEKTEKVLETALSSVFGDKVSDIRSEKGFFPNPKNHFLLEDDGTFAGTFKHDGKKYIFEVFPDEGGWTATYRMHWDDLNDLPPISDSDNEEKNDYTRHVRNRGWR
jgi:hypothetical protein